MVKLQTLNQTLVVLGGKEELALHICSHAGMAGHEILPRKYRMCCGELAVRFLHLCSAVRGDLTV